MGKQGSSSDLNVLNMESTASRHSTNWLLIVFTCYVENFTGKEKSHDFLSNPEVLLKDDPSLNKVGVIKSSAK